MAGPGSGKTTKIIQEVDRLVDNGVKLEKILILTFSKEAVRELINRIKSLTEKQTEMSIFTFHSFCMEIIKSNRERLGFNLNYKILDETNAAILIHLNSNFTLGKSQIYADTILKSKDLGIELGDYEKYLDVIKYELREYGESISDIGENLIQKRSKIHLENDIKMQRKLYKNMNEVYRDLVDYDALVKAWKSYEKIKKNKNLIDYPDMNIYALEYLANDDTILQNYDYIIVDEFQDTNELQYQLIKKFTEYNENVMVVGDVNQSIYGFRGSKRGVIESFIDDFKITETDKLNISYRCDQNILDVAKEMVQKNYSEGDIEESKFLLDLKSNNKQNGKLKILEFQNKEHEAEYVVNEIKKLVNSGVEEKEIMVLYRSHKYADELKRSMKENEINFTSVDKDNLLMKSEIKTIIEYLSILNSSIESNVFNSQGWWRIFHKNVQLSSSDSRLLGDYLRLRRNNMKYLYELILKEGLEKLNISEDGKRKIEIVVERLEKLRESIDKSLSELVYDIIEITGVASDYVNLDKSMNISKKLNIKYFLELLENYENIYGGELNDFMNYLDLFYKDDFKYLVNKERENDGIKVLTMHSSKGLESKYLFLIGWNNKIFPTIMRGRQEKVPEIFDSEYLEWSGMLDIDTIFQKSKDYGYLKLKEEQKKFRKIIEEKEERRLGYVALTRAKSNLKISYVETPSKYLIEFQENDSLDEKIEVEKIDLNLNKKESLEDDIIKDLKLKIFENINQGYYDESLDLLKQLKSMKLNQKKDMKNYIPIDLKLSYSSLKNYNTCPKMFELKDILKLPMRSNIVESSGLEIGNLVHKILEFKVKNRRDVWDLYDEYVSKNEEISEEIKNKVKMYVNVWLSREYDENVFYESEKEFNILINKQIINGKIDRIDKSDEGYIIVDYKTGKNEVEAKDRNLQLSIYAEACKQLYGDYPNKLILDELGFELKSFILDKKTGLAINEYNSRLRFNVYEEIKKVGETIDNVKNDLESTFDLTDKEYKCRYCSYKLYCERWDM